MKNILQDLRQEMHLYQKMLSNTKLKEEIDATKKAIESMKETIKKCEDGIEVNRIVLEAFALELSKKQ